MDLLSACPLHPVEAGEGVEADQTDRFPLLRPEGDRPVPVNLHGAVFFGREPFPSAQIECGPFDEVELSHIRPLPARRGEPALLLLRLDRYVAAGERGADDHPDPFAEGIEANLLHRFGVEREAGHQKSAAPFFPVLQVDRPGVRKRRHEPPVADVSAVFHGETAFRTIRVLYGGGAELFSGTGHPRRGVKQIEKGVFLLAPRREGEGFDAGPVVRRIHRDDGVAGRGDVELHAAVGALWNDSAQALLPLISPAAFAVSGGLVGEGAVRDGFQRKRRHILPGFAQTGIPVKHFNLNRFSCPDPQREGLRVIVCHLQNAVSGGGESAVGNEMFPPASGRAAGLEAAVRRGFPVDAELIVEDRGGQPFFL